MIDVDPVSPLAAAPALIRELTQPHAANVRMALRGTARYEPRLHRYASLKGGTVRRPDAPSRLVVANPGTIDGLQWMPSSVRKPGPYDVQLRVRAAGINFRDVLLTLDMYHGEGVALGAFLSHCR